MKPTLAQKSFPLIVGHPSPITVTHPYHSVARSTIGPRLIGYTHLERGEEGKVPSKYAEKKKGEDATAGSNASLRRRGWRRREASKDSI